MKPDDNSTSARKDDATEQAPDHVANVPAEMNKTWMLRARSEQPMEADQVRKL